MVRPTLSPRDWAVVLSESVAVLVDKLLDGRKDVPGWASRAVLSAAPVMLSLVLSRVDLEESGVWGWLVVVVVAEMETTYELLLSLGVEILACGLRHVDVCCGGRLLV